MGSFTLRQIMENDKMKIEWIWEPRIPKGYVTLLGASGGTGKSGFALWLANELADNGIKTLYVDAENTLSHMSERSRDWNLANADDIYFEAEKDAYGRIVSGYKDPLSIIATAKKVGATLIIVDSLMRSAGNYDMKSERDAMKFMVDMSNIAFAVDGAVLLLCHAKKPIDLSRYILNAHEIAGSHAIVDLARSVLLMKSDESDESLKTITHGKYNFSAPAPDLTFKIDETGIHNMQESIPVAPFVINSGSKTDVYKVEALAMAKDGKNKREIRSAVKQLGANEVEASRVIAWLRTAHNFII